MEAVSLGEVLAYRARQSPGKTAYIYLRNGEEEAARLTYRELDQRARAVASAIRAHDAVGLRILLLFAPGLDFITALFGCFYAGAVAVPAYPPDPMRLERTLPRLRAIVKDASPALVLTTSDLVQFGEAILSKASELGSLPWLAVDTLKGEGGAQAEVEPDDLAFIQYTSGSTSTPKGVMVTHEGVLANLAMIKSRCGQGEGRSLACWVPFYHDMGLVCGILLPAFFGGPSVLMSPLDFLQRPVRWLKTIQKYRITDTCAPNFSLDLCTKKITPEQRASLDLSSLKVFVISAEPVRHSSLQRFLQVFERQGLSPGCVMPAYGLAEAVVAVAIARPGEPPSAAWIDPDALQENRWAELAPDDPRARPVVRCGPPLDDVRVEIIDPESRARCAPGQVGEICVAGANVALGYLNRSADTRETFHARLADGDGPFLRTGDLGYFKDGELYVTGRIKDLIIIWGKNHYPQDIELTVERCHPALRAGCIIAFSVDVLGAERLVIVAEVDRERLGGAPEEHPERLKEVAQAVRLGVSAEYGVQVYDVALIKAKTIDKTSSGKLARRTCRQRYLEGALDAELPSHAGELPTTGQITAISTRPRAADAPSAGPSVAARLRGSPPEARRPLADAYVRHLLGGVLGPDAERILHGEARLEFGLDSLAALELTGRLDKDLGLKPPLGRLHEAVTVEWLVHFILENLDTADPVTSSNAWSVRPSSSRLAVALQPMVVRRPIFCVGGLPGAVLHLRALSRALGREQPLYALQAPGIDGREPPLRRVESLAERYLDEIRRVQPRGPYVLAGYSFGGLCAYEIAQRLGGGEAHGAARVLLLDTVTVAPGEGPAPPADPAATICELVEVFRRFNGQRDAAPLSQEEVARLDAAEQRALLLRELSSAGASGATGGGAAREDLVDSLIAVYEANLEAMRNYRPRSYAGPVTLLRAEDGLPRELSMPSRKLALRTGDPSFGWGALSSDLRVIRVPGDHLSMVVEPHTGPLADAIREEVRDVPYLEIGPQGGFSATGSLPPPHSVPPSLPPSLAPPSRPLVFNPFHPDFVEDPYPLLNRLRTEDPVHWSEMSLWCISRYKDVCSGLRDKRFSADARRAGPRKAPRGGSREGRISMSVLSGHLRDDEASPQARLYNNLMMTLDPPRHTRLRRLAAPLFEPNAVRRWRGFIEETVDAMLGEAMARGDVDIVRDLALPLPITVVATLLGLPREDIPTLRRWSLELTQSFDPLITKEVLDRGNQVAEEFIAYLRDHVAPGKRRPGGELLDMMVAAQEDGDVLTEDELIANCVLFFMAGFETASNVIGNGLLALLRNPDQLRLLKERPEIIENATEELLRYDGAFRHIFRVAVDDVELGGKLIRNGDYVLFLVPAANRDPDEFPDPDRLDLTRKIRQHVAFGHGIHYCLGAPLARLEIQAAVLRAIQLMPEMKLAPEGLRWRKSLSLRGLDAMPVIPG